MTGLSPGRRCPVFSMVSLAALVLTGCGGGGSSSSGGNSGPVATKPQFTSSSTVSVPENASGTFYTATASDPQGDPITIRIEGGADAGSFVLDGGSGLRFNASPNYDLPKDSNGDNVYEVVLRATAGGENTDLSLAVTVSNSREGISVKRVASGLVDPVAMAPLFDGLKFVVAEKGGRVLQFDNASATLTEMSLVNARKRPGEILDAVFYFDSLAYSEGILLLTHSAADGLLLQGVNNTSGRTYSRQLATAWTQPTKAAIFPARRPSAGLLVAIGDPSGNLAQDASSGYGKLWDVLPGDPYAGASLPSGLTYVVQQIGDGIAAPDGGGIFFDQTFLVDQGLTTEHEVTFFQHNWRPLDFGWPFYEGATSVRSTPPAQVNGPSLAYRFGTGRGQGTGIIAGVGYAGGIAGIEGHYIFGDKSGKVWSIPSNKLNDGFLHSAADIENRTEDFKPDAGTIDSPVAFAIALQTVFILDSDGEIFRVDAS